MTAATLSVLEACEVLGISESHGRALLRDDKFPAPVLKMGGVTRVPRRPLYAVVGEELPAA